jgi:hypothetical protein
MSVVGTGGEGQRGTGSKVMLWLGTVRVVGHIRRPSASGTFL